MLNSPLKTIVSIELSMLPFVLARLVSSYLENITARTTSICIARRAQCPTSSWQQCAICAPIPGHMHYSLSTTLWTWLCITRRHHSYFKLSSLYTVPLLSPLHWLLYTYFTDRPNVKVHFITFHSRSVKKQW